MSKPGIWLAGTAVSQFDNKLENPLLTNMEFNMDFTE